VLDTCCFCPMTLPATAVVVRENAGDNGTTTVVERVRSNPKPGGFDLKLDELQGNQVFEKSCQKSARELLEELLEGENQPASKKTDCSRLGSCSENDDGVSTASLHDSSLAEHDEELNGTFGCTSNSPPTHSTGEIEPSTLQPSRSTDISDSEANTDVQTRHCTRRPSVCER
jgi:hypothetical protein